MLRSGREKKNRRGWQPARGLMAADEYARVLASMSVAHVVSVGGCTSIQKSALNALVDIMEKCKHTGG